MSSLAERQVPVANKDPELGEPPLNEQAKQTEAESVQSAPEIESLNMTLIIVYFAANAGASRRNAGKAVEMVKSLCLMILEAVSMILEALGILRGATGSAQH